MIRSKRIFYFILCWMPLGLLTCSVEQLPHEQTGAICAKEVKEQSTSSPTQLPKKGVKETRITIVSSMFYAGLLAAPLLALPFFSVALYNIDRHIWYHIIVIFLLREALAMLCGAMVGGAVKHFANGKRWLRNLLLSPFFLLLPCLPMIFRYRLGIMSLLDLLSTLLTFIVVELMVHIVLSDPKDIAQLSWGKRLQYGMAVGITSSYALELVSIVFPLFFSKSTDYKEILTSPLKYEATFLLGFFMLIHWLLPYLKPNIKVLKGKWSHFYNQCICSLLTFLGGVLYGRLWITKEWKKVFYVGLIFFSLLRGYRLLIMIARYILVQPAPKELSAARSPSAKTTPRHKRSQKRSKIIKKIVVWLLELLFALPIAHLLAYNFSFKLILPEDIKPGEAYLSNMIQDVWAVRNKLPEKEFWALVKNYNSFISDPEKHTADIKCEFKKYSREDLSFDEAIWCNSKVPYKVIILLLESQRVFFSQNALWTFVKTERMHPWIGQFLLERIFCKFFSNSLLFPDDLWKYNVSPSMMKILLERKDIHVKEKDIWEFIKQAAEMNNPPKDSIYHKDERKKFLKQLLKRLEEKMLLDPAPFTLPSYNFSRKSIWDNHVPYDLVVTLLENEKPKIQLSQKDFETFVDHWDFHNKSKNSIPQNSIPQNSIHHEQHLIPLLEKMLPLFESGTVNLPHSILKSKHFVDKALGMLLASERTEIDEGFLWEFLEACGATEIKNADTLLASILDNIRDDSLSVSYIVWISKAPYLLIISLLENEKVKVNSADFDHCIKLFQSKDTTRYKNDEIEKMLEVVLDQYKDNEYRQLCLPEDMWSSGMPSTTIIKLLESNKTAILSRSDEKYLINCIKNSIKEGNNGMPSYNEQEGAEMVKAILDKTGECNISEEILEYPIPPKIMNSLLNSEKATLGEGAFRAFIEKTQKADKAKNDSIYDKGFRGQVVRKMIKKNKNLLDVKFGLSADQPFLQYLQTNKEANGDLIKVVEDMEKDKAILKKL